MPDLPWERRLGATPASTSDGTPATTFRVWAPNADGRVTLRLADETDHELTHAGHGVYEATVENAPHGTEYAYILGGAGATALPDPCSRHQPRGLRDVSAVVDPATFTWTTDDFTPTPLDQHAVIYELHIGTFSPHGTFESAIDHLDELAANHITHIEVMPIAEFPGTFGWGYDGVYISAAHSTYGGPEGFQKLVDAAHARGLAVILDVVYNHLGASGNKAMTAFGPYYTDKHETFWGASLNYDDEHADPVREWALQSAEGWIRDFRVDGLRLDAIHTIFDDSARPLISELTERVHAINPDAVVIAESGLNDPKVIRPHELGGWGCDAQWADDFHHCLRTLLAGDEDGYYAEFGDIDQLAKALRRPFVFDGIYSPGRKRRYGAKADDRPPHQFVVFDQNHDQVGNRAFGDRLPDEQRRIGAFLTLLSPFTPMLFMGEEYGEGAPFQFFADHIDHDIAVATREGRRREFAAFAQFAGEEIPDPISRETFENSKLTRRRHDEIADLYARLLKARRDVHGEATDIETIGDRAIRFRRGEHLIVANLGGPPLELPEGEIVLATGSDGRTLTGLGAALLRV